MRNRYVVLSILGGAVLLLLILLSILLGLAMDRTSATAKPPKVDFPSMISGMRKLNRQKELVLETEDYKRPRAPAPSKLLEPWYRARSFTICHNDKLTDELFSRDIVDRLKQDFTFLLPYYDYFVTLEGDPDPRDAAPV